MALALRAVKDERVRPLWGMRWLACSSFQSAGYEPLGMPACFEPQTPSTNTCVFIGMR